MEWGVIADIVNAVAVFDGPGAAAGDHLDFFGFAFGATLTHTAVDTYVIHDGVNPDETITIHGDPTLAAADYLFH
jgi:hypothetical protein